MTDGKDMDLAEKSFHEDENETIHSGLRRTAIAGQEFLGRQIGSYLITSKIGEGGMGTVYLAKQSSDSLPKVALKIVKNSVFDKEKLSRFENEIKTISLMNHPNIAKLLDVGQTLDGVPFFVMEFIDGMPITDYCDKEKLDIHRRLDLAISACKAVSYAHKIGVIHRDLKPSNILVQKRGESVEVKIIDFGVAKIVNPLDDDPSYTIHGQVMGTPEYMSPEQATGEQHKVDVRTDVFSLGVLLFELLVGSTPIDKRSFEGIGFPKIIQKIQNFEAIRPSSRFIRAGESGTVLSQNRSTTTTGLSKLLKGDIDWIVRKCTEREVELRYGSCDQLVQDLSSFLENKPVIARPPSFFYSFRKLVRRNQVAFGFSVLLFTVTISALIGGWILAWQATQSSIAERNAKDAAVLAKKNAESSLEKAKESARAAKLAELRAQAALNLFLDPISKIAPYHSARDLLSSELIWESCVNSKSALKDDPVGRAKFLNHCSKALMNVGRYQKAIIVAKDAIDVFESVSEQDNDLYLNSLSTLCSLLDSSGQKTEALKVSKKLRLVTEKGSFHKKEELIAAIRWSTVELKSSSDHGRFSVSSFQRCKEALNTLQSEKIIESEELITLRIDFCRNCFTAGKIHYAEDYLSRTTAHSTRILGEKHKLTMTAMKLAASFCFSQKNYVDCDQKIKEVIGKFGEEALRDSQHLPFQLMRMKMCNILQRLGEATDLYRFCNPVVKQHLTQNGLLFRQFTEEYIQTLIFQRNYDEAYTVYKKSEIEFQKAGFNVTPVSNIFLTLADGFYRAERPQKAIELYKKAYQYIQENHVGSDAVSKVLIGLCNSYRSSKEYDLAVKFGILSVDHAEKNFEESDPVFGRAHYRLGRIYQEYGKSDLAVVHLDKSFDLIYPIFKRKGEIELGRIATWSRFVSGNSFFDRKMMKEASAKYEDAIRIQKHLLYEIPGIRFKDARLLALFLTSIERLKERSSGQLTNIDLDKEFLRLIRWIDTNLGRENHESMFAREYYLHYVLSDPDRAHDALEICSELEEVSKKLIERNPKDIDAWRTWLVVVQHKARCYGLLDLYRSKNRCLQRVLDGLEEAVEVFSPDLAAYRKLNNCIIFGLRKKELWDGKLLKKLLNIQDVIDKRLGRASVN